MFTPWRRGYRPERACDGGDRGAVPRPGRPARASEALRALGVPASSGVAPRFGRSRRSARGGSGRRAASTGDPHARPVGTRTSRRTAVDRGHGAVGCMPTWSRVGGSVRMARCRTFSGAVRPAGRAPRRRLAAPGAWRRDAPASHAPAGPGEGHVRDRREALPRPRAARAAGARCGRAGGQARVVHAHAPAVHAAAGAHEQRAGLADQPRRRARPRSSTRPVRACRSRASWPTRSPSRPSARRSGPCRARRFGLTTFAPRWA